MVSGYDWVLKENSNINWVETKVVFKTPPAKIRICKVSARNFHKHSQEPGATTYMVSNLGSTPHSGYSINPIHTKSAELDANSPTFPPEYQEFANVFSGEKVNMLAPHHPYDLQINTEGDMKPFYSPIYSLSQPELMALCEFLDENTQNGFIRPSSSPWGSPVLFIKKKDGSLQPSIDYHALNKVTRKDQYPLPLICDLLDSLGPPRIYTKINLKHTYHLVQITEGDKSK